MPVKYKVSTSVLDFVDKVDTSVYNIVMITHETTISNIHHQNKHWDFGKLNTYEFKRDIFYKIWKDLDTKLMALITGPRRVGKSVLLKQLVNELIVQKNIQAKQMLFYEFLPRDDQDKIWSVFDYFIKEVANQKGPIYIFFDEIQYVDGYEAMIKNIYDNTDNCKIFITGSLSLTYKRRMQDSLAGRFFSYKMFPLNFLEFLKLNKPDSLKDYEEILLEKTDKFRKRGLLSNLNPYFREFLISGRYPETFNMTSEQTKAYLLDIINQTLNQDAYSYFRIELPNVMNSLFEHIRQNNGGLISIAKLANQTGSSPKTVTLYLSILEQMGIIYLIYNSTNPLIKYQSTKKAYVNSSFSLLDSKLDIGTAYGFAVEAYVLERLLEKGKNITFYRNRQKEIDFLIPKENIGYEVKFRSDPPKIKYKLNDYKLETISLDGKHPACLF